MAPGDFVVEDLGIFFAADEFATNATIGAATIQGILDDEYIEDLDIAGTRPVLICRTSDVTAVAQGTVVTINETAYTVVDIRPDGTGVTRLILQEP